MKAIGCLIQVLSCEETASDSCIAGSAVLSVLIKLPALRT